MTDYYAAAERHYTEGEGALSRNDFRRAQARATLALAAIELAKARRLEVQIPSPKGPPQWTFHPGERDALDRLRERLEREVDFSAPVRAEIDAEIDRLAKARRTDPDEEVLNILLVVNEQDGREVEPNPGEHLTLVPVDRVHVAVLGRKVRYVGSTGPAYRHHKWRDAREVVRRAELRTNPTD